MKKIIYLTIPLVLFACNQPNEKKEGESTDQKEIQVDKYPETRKDSVVNDYFGTKVADPYRWLENDTSKETTAWVKEENKVTTDYLSQIPYREQIKERLTSLWNYEKESVPFKKGKFYFFFKNDGIQNQSVLYYQRGLDGEASVLLDPNTLSADGTAAINGMGFSKNAQYMAYGVSYAGSDWVEIHLLNLETKKPLDDVIKHVKFSGISWKDDGFYYSAYPSPDSSLDYTSKNESQSIYYHKLGTVQKTDQLIYRDDKHPLRNAYAAVTEDERYLIISTSESTNGNGILIKNLVSDQPIVTVVNDFGNESNIIDHIGGGKFLVETNYKAPNNRLCIIDLKQPAKGNWKELIPEKDYVLSGVSLASDKIIANYMKDVKSKIEIYDLSGNYISDIQLPGQGIASFSGDKETDTGFYSFTSYITPTTIYQYNLETDRSSIFFQSNSAFKSEDYTSEQVFYKSKDGTKVPLYIVYKKGIKKDGNNPCFLYGYGGFNISITPSYSPKIALFLEQGGIYAVATLRGGSEYGEAWHEAGMQYNKQNVFDDFIAAAEYLIDSNYTSTPKLAIHGRSNGGLLVGAVMTQRPDLMKVAIPTVGVMDMLRYNKFTIGWAWAGEYGTSEESKKSFKNLYSYSPLHNIIDGSHYPATMVTTADHDDRVVPAHSFKFISTLQAKNKGDNPVLIRIDVDAGHGSGKPTSKTIDEWTDIWSFVLWNTKAETNFEEN